MRGNYPYPGGWSDQPLDLLVRFQAYDLAFTTYTSNGGYNEQGKRIPFWYSLTELNATQRDLVRWMEND